MPSQLRQGKVNLLAPDHLKMQFQEANPNMCWGVDITILYWALVCVTTKGKKEFKSPQVYYIMDHATGFIKGFDVKTSLISSDCYDVTEKAILERDQEGVPLIIHSDRGPQFLSRKWLSLGNYKGVLISMTPANNPKFNSPIERMHQVLKNPETWANAKVPLPGFQKDGSIYAKPIVFESLARFKRYLGFVINYINNNMLLLQRAMGFTPSICEAKFNSIGAESIKQPSAARSISEKMAQNYDMDFPGSFSSVEVVEIANSRKKIAGIEDISTRVPFVEPVLVPDITPPGSYDKTLLRGIQQILQNQADIKQNQANALLDANQVACLQMDQAQRNAAIAANTAQSNFQMVYGELIRIAANTNLSEKPLKGLLGELISSQEAMAPNLKVRGNPRPQTDALAPHHLVYFVASLTPECCDPQLMRNVLAITLQRGLGRRLSEICKMTYGQLDSLIKEKSTNMFSSKQNVIFTVAMSDEYVSMVACLNSRLKDLLWNLTEVAVLPSYFVFAPLNVPHKHLTLASQNRAINHQLKVFEEIINSLQDEMPVLFTSQSARVSYVTSLLEGHLPVETVSEMVDHSAIKTTVRYSRRMLAIQKKKAIIDLALSPEMDRNSLANPEDEP